MQFFQEKKIVYKLYAGLFIISTLVRRRKFVLYIAKIDVIEHEWQYHNIVISQCPLKTK